MCLEGALPREGLQTFTCLTLTPHSGQSNHSSGQSNRWSWWWCSVTMILLSWEGDEFLIHFNPIDDIIITVITISMVVTSNDDVQAARITNGGKRRSCLCCCWCLSKVSHTLPYFVTMLPLLVIFVCHNLSSLYNIHLVVVRMFFPGLYYCITSSVANTFYSNTEIILSCHAFQLDSWLTPIFKFAPTKATIMSFRLDLNHLYVLQMRAARIIISINILIWSSLYLPVGGRASWWSLEVLQVILFNNI